MIILSTASIACNAQVDDAEDPYAGADALLLAQSAAVVPARTKAPKAMPAAT